MGAYEEVLNDMTSRLLAATEANIGYERQIRSLKAELKASQDSLARLERPVFEVGKCYRNRRGEIRGPLKARNFGTCYVLEDNHGTTYTSEGVEWEGLRRDGDLLPGPVDPPPTWTPPKSLKSGEYKSTDHVLTFFGGEIDLYHAQLARVLEGYSKPANGRWRVENGVATWMGDA